MLFLTGIATAQNSQDILQRIETEAAHKDAYSVRFTEVRTPAAKDRAKEKLEGQMEYKGEEYLSMDYANGDLFRIEGNTMTFIRDGKTTRFDTAKNLMMGNLKAALMLSFKGRLQDLADKQDAAIEAARDGANYVVTLTARKKSPRGYSLIRIHYSPSGDILDMQMDEFSGASTFYAIKG